MPKIRIVNATGYQNGGANLISAAARAKLATQLNYAATIDTRMASHRLKNDYLKVEARIASAIDIWRATNRMGNATQVDGLPFTNNGDVYVVISNQSPAPGGHNSAAYSDLNNNRIVINPAFAELLLNDKVFYISSNGVRKTLTMADVILHELGHRTDGNSLYAFTGKDEDASNGKPVDLDAEKLEALNQISTNSDERFRTDHDVLYMYDANGVPHSIRDMTVEQVRSTFPGLVSNAPTARILDGLNGKKYLVDGPTGATVELGEFGGVFGRMAGSALGNYLTRNDNVGVQIAASTVLGSVGEALGNVVLYQNASRDLSLSFDAAFSNFDQTLYNNLKSASIGALTAFTTMELGRAVGLSGFGAELFNAASGSAIGPVYDKVINNILSNKAAFDGFNVKGIFGGSANVGNIVGAGIASFFGAKLGSLVVTPNTAGSAALASLGSAAGAYVLSGGGSAAIGGVAAKIFGQLGIYANIVGPGIGAFVGFVLGAFIGNLFGKKKPRTPSASAEVTLELTQADFRLGTVSSANGGNTAFVTGMAETAEKTLDGILANLMEGNRSRLASVYSPSQSYGHSGQQIQARFMGGSWQNFATADAAVDWGILTAIRATGVAGGNLIAKRVVAASPATTVSALLGDLQVAYDYELYLRNRATINAMIANDPKSEFAAAWIITLGRVSELGINTLRPSDFQGGLAGFIDGAVDATTTIVPSYENYLWNGSAALTSTDGSFSSIVSDDRFTIAFSGSTLSQVGIVQWSGQATAGNDFWNASGGGSVVMDDVGYHEEWQWNPWDYTYEPYYVEVSGGDDIFVGSAQNDTLAGRQGFDWLDGGAGDDVIDGGENADVLLGRAGNDRMLGGNGDDYLAGGDGDDYFYDANRTWGLYGGEGNDVLVGGGGTDALYGENGDDIFIVDQDGGVTWDALTGGSGSDTLSYERFTGGVHIDFAALGGWSWDPTARYIYGDAIAGSMENVTGSRFADTLLGDAGANALKGLDGSDFLNGREGDDIIEGGEGDDIIHGGWGSDTASYRNSDSGVVVSLQGIATEFDPFFYGSYYSDLAPMAHDHNWLRSHYDNHGRYEGRKPNAIFDTSFYLSTYSDVAAAGVNPLEHYRVAGVHESRSPGPEQRQNNTAMGADAAGDSLFSIENLMGSAHGDELTGNIGNNIISGLGGDDIIVLTDGDDVIDGGGGLDTIDATFARNPLTVYYDSGSYDPYYGYYAPGAGWIATTGSGTTTFASIERFVGTAFADSIAGSGGNEIFDGGGGNDYLVGAGGSDTFVFGRGDGQDTVYSSSAGASAILMKENINWRDVSLAGANSGQQNGNLTVAIRGTSDQMVVGGNFSYVNSGNSAGQHNHAIKSLNLGGVSAVDIDMIDWTPWAADEGSTVVYGGQNRADVIFAYGGDDTIYTAGSLYGYETRSNVVYAGDGNDTIHSSYGDDQFIFERGNGIDTLTDSGGADTIVMGPSVASGDVIYEVVTTAGGTADLYIGIRDGGNPNATASQVADRIRIVDGGTKTVNVNYGYETLNTIEHVRVGGQEIDLTKADINWAISYDYSGGYYPIALDLDGDGIELRSVEGSRIASVQADGTITRMGWLGQDDGFLALDRDGNGVIDRIGEISFVGDREGAKTDLEGLTAYDSNDDGKLDASDKRWGEFKVWQDKNQDGFGSKDELVTLDKAGIASISLQGQLTGFTRADGPDNTVIATTEVTWTDKGRTGSAYDVMLAWRQVRTDDGAKSLAATDALARGVKLDDLEARLHGIQSLTDEQVKAIRAKNAQAKGQGDGGQLHRIEDLLNASTKLVGGAVAKVANGLLSIDPGLASKVASGSRALNLIDRYAGNDWSKLGSIAQAEADMRGATTKIEKLNLADVQEATIENARNVVKDRNLADSAKAVAAAAKDAVDAVLRPAPTPPTAEELVRLKQIDPFRLLGGKTGTSEVDESADLGANAINRDLMRQLGLVAVPETAAQLATVPYPTEHGPIDQEADTEVAASAPANVPPGRPVISDEQAQSTEAKSADTDLYGVVIRTANARLVQALASFGDAPAMMASYQGLGVVNDAQAAWLSVDAMPSIQRMAAIR